MQLPTAAPCANVSIPSVTSLIRGDFYQLMQSLERDECGVNRTYILELALTLVRLDPHLKEEESRVFIHTFDCMTRRLSVELRRLMEMESLLRENLHLLSELTERCRTLDKLWSGYYLTTDYEARGPSNAPGSVSNSTPLRASSERRESSGACDPSGALSDTSVSSDLKSVHPSNFGPAVDSVRQQMSTACADNSGEMVVSSTPRPSGGGHRVAEDPLQLCSKAASRNQDCVEEFLELMSGQLTSVDAATIVHMLEAKPDRCNDKFCSGRRQICGSTYDESMYAVSGKSSYVGLKGNVMNDNGDISRFGSHVSLMDYLSSRRCGYGSDGTESFSRVDNSSFNVESSAPSSFTANAAPIRSVNRIALYLCVFADMVASGETSFARLLQKTRVSVRDGGLEGLASELSSFVNRWRDGSTRGEIVGSIPTLPSRSALGFLPVVFPLMRSYFHDFPWRAENTTSEEGGAANVTPGLVHDSPTRRVGTCSRPTALATGGGCSNYAGIGGLGDNIVEIEATNGAGVLSTVSTGCVPCPVDVVLFALLRSLRRKQSTGAVASGGLAQEGDRAQIEGANICLPTEPEIIEARGDVDTGGVAVVRRVWVEFQTMIEEVQNGICAAQAMRKQIQEELTLLCFRVVTTTLELLIPAALSVDQRRALFFRKWVCDIYRLLLEEGLLGRFSALVNSAALLQPSENANSENCASAGIPPITPQQRKKRTSAKCTSGVTTRRGSLVCALADDGGSSPQNDCGPSVLREETGAYFVPGTAYSRHFCSLVKGGARALDGNVASGPVAEGSGSLIQTAIAASYPSSRFTHGRYYRRGDPTVAMAEFLFEDAPIETLSQCPFVVTRLMATLLRGGDMIKASASIHATERSSGSVNGSFAGMVTNEPPGSAPRKVVSSIKPHRQPTRKKVTSQCHAQGGVPRKGQSAPAAADGKPTQSQRSVGRASYPLVNCASDVKALYSGVLCDAELLLSPLDPIRAAIVQNTVDFLTSVTQAPGEAFELLDTYLDDVVTEQIQLPATQRFVSDCTADGGAGGQIHSPRNVEQAFSSVSLRRLRNAVGEAAPAGGSRTNASVRSCSVQQKRSSVGTERDVNVCALLTVPVIPTVIPSWNSPEESAQFMAVLSLLRHEHMTLKSSFGMSGSPPWLDQGEE